MTANKKLLVVDDHVEITDLISEVAGADGYDVSTINKSSEFFDSFDQIKPDTVCIDIHMPDVDGIEILRWLSDRECRANVIILSGGDPLFTKVAERIGEAANLSVQTIVKPFQLSEFRAALGVSAVPAADTA